MPLVDLAQACQSLGVVGCFLQNFFVQALRVLVVTAQTKGASQPQLEPETLGLNLQGAQVSSDGAREVAPAEARVRRLFVQVFRVLVVTAQTKGAKPAPASARELSGSISKARK